MWTVGTFFCAVLLTKSPCGKILVSTLKNRVVWSSNPHYLYHSTAVLRHVQAGAAQLWAHAQGSKAHISRCMMQIMEYNVGFASRQSLLVC